MNEIVTKVYFDPEVRQGGKQVGAWALWARKGIEITHVESWSTEEEARQRATEIEAGKCCEGPHVRPCGDTGDDCFCACGCSGLDERCWAEEEA